MDAATLHRRPFVICVLVLTLAAIAWGQNPAAAQLRPGDILYVDRVPGESVSSLHTVGVRVFDGSIDRIDSVTGRRTVVVSGLLDPVQVVAVVPEPATAELCAALAAITLARRRRRTNPPRLPPSTEESP